MKIISKDIRIALKGNKKTRTLFLLSLIVLAILGSLYVRYTWITNMNITTQQALKSAKIAEASLNGEGFKELNAEKADIGKTEYESIKTRLTNLVGIEEGVRFAYIYTQRDGELYFMVDSESIYSKDYSPPGQKYIKATNEDKKPFEDGNPLITKPVTDHWGTWIRVLVPMKAETGETLAVLGMDYPAKTWNDNACYHSLQAGIIVFTLFILEFVVYLTFNIIYMHLLLTKEKQIVEQVNGNIDGFFNTVNDIIFVLDVEGYVIQLNNTGCRKLEYLRAELIGRSVSIIYPQNRSEELLEMLVDMGPDRSVNCAIPVVTKRGIEIPVETHGVMGKWNGKPALFCVIKDISELKKSEEKFSKAFHSNAALMAITTVEDYCFIDANEILLKTLAFNKDEVVGRKALDLDVFIDREQKEKINKELNKNGKVVNIETRLKGKDGVIHNVIFSADSIVLDGAPCCLITIMDITERKKAEGEIRYLSYHDQLTGLYNRRAYREKLALVDTKLNLPLTIVIGDVNGLKLINDSFGHVKGDILLKKVAEVIKKACRPDDIIARLGGDEFVIILPKTNDFEAERILKRINTLIIKEKVGLVDIDISFGYETKKAEEQNIGDVLKKAEDNMYKKKIFESPSIRGKTIDAIISTLHEKNKREELHSHRVSELSESMGVALDLPEYEIMELKTVGLLHDIGKIAIEENILNKPGKLTDDEWEEIKRHSEIGYRIISTVNDMSDMAEYVLAHHERWDGKGYPKGLIAEEIPFQARIIAIVDTYDAMTSDRSYRGALPQEVAVQELQKNAGIQFDPDLVRVFVEKVVGKS